MKLPNLTVVGHSNSGKTTLITLLIGELKRRGWRLAAIKHAHHGLDLTPPAKDSTRLLEAGAEAVLVVAPGRVELLRAVGEDWSIHQAVGRELDGVDLVIAEGFKKEAFPRIEVHRSAVSNDLISKPSDLFALVSDRIWQLPVPSFTSEDWLSLCDLIEKTWLTSRDRTPKVIVNGRLIPLTTFATRYIASAVSGLLRPLKGMESGCEYRLEIEGMSLRLSNGTEQIPVKYFLQRSIRGAILGIMEGLDGVQDPFHIIVTIPRGKG